MVKGPPPDRRFLWILLPCAAVLTLAAWLRGAEYDEQYTLFLTSGMPRPEWPDVVFSAGLARQIQSGSASLASIASDLRITDVHPPLYFWLVSLWRRVLGHGLFDARLFSVALGTGALGLTGEIARLSRIRPVRTMLLTLGCYGFTYTSVVARGFALAQLLVLGGVVCLLLGRRARHFALAGLLFGAATLTNYLSVFVAGACLFAIVLMFVLTKQREPARPMLIAVMLGFLLFIPGDLWWFLAQRGSRQGQFEPFSLTASVLRLTVRFTGNLLGGLPLYVDRSLAPFVTAGLGVLLVWLMARVIWGWHEIGVPWARRMFALAALAPPCGLLFLGFIFNNTPIEVRYLSFSTPFIGLLLAGALGRRDAAIMLAVQALAIAGLMLAPQTMQPARATARAAAAFVENGLVLLPRGNDGVGVVGGFAIEAPPSLPLLLVRAEDTPVRIRARITGWHRVVLALMEQDALSRAESEAMRQALQSPDWREVARGPNVAVYERVNDAE